MKKMNEESKALVSAFCVLMACLCLMILCGCQTKRVVTEVVKTDSIHDTVYSVKKDTVKEIHHTHYRDSSWERHDNEVTLNEKGDTVKQVINNYFYTLSEKEDSSMFYKAIADSLSKVLKETKTETEKEEVKVVKGPTFLERAVFGYATIFIILIVIFMVIKFKKS